LRRNGRIDGGYRPFDAHRKAVGRRARHHKRRLERGGFTPDRSATLTIHPIPLAAPVPDQPISSTSSGAGGALIRKPSTGLAAKASPRIRPVGSV